MSNTIRRTLISRKRKIHHRLDRATRADRGKPVIHAGNIHYELSGRTAAISHGGIGAMHMLVGKVGLAKRIDEKVHVLKQHSPYYGPPPSKGFSGYTLARMRDAYICIQGR